MQSKEQMVKLSMDVLMEMDIPIYSNQLKKVKK